MRHIIDLAVEDIQAGEDLFLIIESLLDEGITKEVVKAYKKRGRALAVAGKQIKRGLQGKPVSKRALKVAGKEYAKGTATAIGGVAALKGIKGEVTDIRLGKEGRKKVKSFEKKQVQKEKIKKAKKALEKIKKAEKKEKSEAIDDIISAAISEED